MSRNSSVTFSHPESHQAAQDISLSELEGSLPTAQIVQHNPDFGHLLAEDSDPDEEDVFFDATEHLVSDAVTNSQSGAGTPCEPSAFKGFRARQLFRLRIFFSRNNIDHLEILDNKLDKLKVPAIAVSGMQLMGSTSLNEENWPPAWETNIETVISWVSNTLHGWMVGMSTSDVDSLCRTGFVIQQHNDLQVELTESQRPRRPACRRDVHILRPEDLDDFQPTNPGCMNWYNKGLDPSFVTSAVMNLFRGGQVCEP